MTTKRICQKQLRQGGGNFPLSCSELFLTKNENPNTENSKKPREKAGWTNGR